jgi:hypothetical protein
MENYKALKDAGIISVSKVDDKYYTTRKTFDTDTGVAKDDVVSEIDLSVVKYDLVYINKNIETETQRKVDWEEFETDLEAL